MHCPPPSPLPAAAAASSTHAPASGERHASPRRRPREWAPTPETLHRLGFGPGVAKREPRSTLAQVAQRGLRMQRVNNLPGICSPQPAPQTRLLRTPSARRGAQGTPSDTPPQPGAEGFCFGRDENNDP